MPAWALPVTEQRRRRQPGRAPMPRMSSPALPAHWRYTLGEAIHDVRYEELVNDPLRTGPALARACGLEWNDSALEVEKNAAVSFTASASQARRPIYRSSTGRWRHYRAQLEPLIAALRQAGVAQTELD